MQNTDEGSLLWAFVVSETPCSFPFVLMQPAIFVKYVKNYWLFVLGITLVIWILDHSSPSGHFLSSVQYPNHPFFSYYTYFFLFFYHFYFFSHNHFRFRSLPFTLCTPTAEFSRMCLFPLNLPLEPQMGKSSWSLHHSWHLFVSSSGASSKCSTIWVTQSFTLGLTRFWTQFKFL